VVSPIDERGTENLLLWLISPPFINSRLGLFVADIISRAHYEVRNKNFHLARFEICQNGSKSPVGFFGVGGGCRRQVNPILTLRSSYCSVDLGT